MSDRFIALGRVRKLVEAYKRAPLDGGHLSHRINLAQVWRSRLGNGDDEGSISLSRREAMIPDCTILTDDEVELAFLRVMAFGYGDIGYGPYRAETIAKNMDSMGGASVFIRDLRSRAHEGWESGYGFLCERQVARLGASFATKLLYFASPVEDRSPILDSIISGWLWQYEVASKAEPIDSLTFDLFMYGRYVSFIDQALDSTIDLLSGLEVPDRGLIEYLIFQDRLHHRATKGFAPWVMMVG